MTEHGHTPSGSPEFEDESLEELRARLAALQESVERLGTEPIPTPDPPADQIPAPVPSVAPPAAPYPPPASDRDPASGPCPDLSRPPAPRQPPSPPAPEPDPAYEPVPGYEPGAAFEPMPAATNSHREEIRPAAPPAPPANVSLLDAGPFADLIDLRRFEEEVASLETVREIRVRRFSHGRAQIEIALAGPYPLALELMRLGTPVGVETSSDGQITLELPAPANAVATEPQTSAYAAEAGIEEAGD